MKPLAANTLLQNRYLIVHLIGKGGMGEVYLAIDQRLGSAVALKRTFFSGDVILASAFEREARTLARLRHSVLPKVSDHFIEGDHQYLIMEHIAGDDLAKRLEISRKPFPLEWVLFWADELLAALDYLHAQEPPVIHRDIKPQNLKLTDENSIILLDFGLSKNTLGETRAASTTGSIVGYTPHYAPMEQIRGTGTDARSDLYSLSATVYQLLTNIVPPDVLTRADILLSGQSDPIKPLNEIDAEIDAEISDVILKGMSVSQQQRFADARAMQTALRAARNRTLTESEKKAGAFRMRNHRELPEISQAQLNTNVAPVSRIESNSPNGLLQEDLKPAEKIILQSNVRAENGTSKSRFPAILSFAAPLVLVLAAGLGWFILRNSEAATQTEKISIQTPEAAVTLAPVRSPTPEANSSISNANINAANAASNSNEASEKDLKTRVNNSNENQTSDDKIQNPLDKANKSSSPSVKTTPKPTAQPAKKFAPKPTPTPATPKATPLPRILP